jgi:hypothetical protein
MQTENTEQIEPTPPKTWKRNPETGLVEGIEYKYSPDGRVDWRAMVPEEFLVVNKQNFTNRKLPDSIDGLEDKDLLVLLGGIKYLAALRGYNSVKHTITFREHYAIGVNTQIEWIPNFETDMRPISFESLADATEANTSSFAKAYLSAIAENRGFVRAVRNFLGINVCGQDEIGSPQKHEESAPKTQSDDFGPHTLLTKTLEKGNISFDVFHNRMMVLEKDGKDFAKGASEWTKLEDVNESVVFSIVAFINEGLEKKKKKESKS